MPQGKVKSSPAVKQRGYSFPLKLKQLVRKLSLLFLLKRLLLAAKKELALVNEQKVLLVKK